MKRLISLFMLFFVGPLSAAVLAHVEDVQGRVKLKSEDSIKKVKVQTGMEVQTGDLITSSKNSSVTLKLSDGSDVIVGESSSIRFPQQNELEQTGGKVFYKITSRDAKNSLKVKTPFAIIGIKGTTFIVKSDKENQGVMLKEGLIGVQSIKEQFALYRKEVMAQFNNYKNEQMSEFEKFKNGYKEPEPEMTKEFDLEAGNTISFSGKKVQESGWNEEDDQEFADFEAMLNKDLEEFKNSRE